MITLQALSLFLDQLLSPSSIQDYCPNGLQVEGKGGVKNVAVAVSASLEVIEAAVKMKADALIVHHGMLWQKDPLPIIGPKKEKLRHLLEHGISLFAYHLPLDAHIQIGNNWKASEDLGWKDRSAFGVHGNTSIGVKGQFAPMKIDEFRILLETYYGHPAQCALGGKSVVSSAALVSGGAHWDIIQAADQGVDCFITGSFDEPIWDIAHERKVNFFALGHYATERVGVMALSKLLIKQFGVASSFIDVANPF